MQVYLPDDLYALVKARGLPASELLQKAVRAELRRQELLTEADRYIADLIADVGPPAVAQRKHAAAVARRLNAVDMVRSIREAHYAKIKDLSPEEKIRFFREKARALHSELGKPEELPQNQAPATRP